MGRGEVRLGWESGGVVRWITACALVLVILLGAARAQASSWRDQQIPPAEVPSGQLQAISCPTTHWCIAVGSYVNPIGRTVALAERFNGHRWARMPTFNPRKATVAGGLSAVSCTSPTACIAVGGALAERWNGRRWTVHGFKTFAISLSGVSCWSADGCVAVGTDDDKGDLGGSFVARWQGGVWTVQQDPQTGGGDALYGVSCVSAVACLAVGATVTDSDGDTVTLALTWNGRRWSLQVPGDAGGSDGFNGVACSTANTCVAVGGYVNAVGSNRPLVERWHPGPHGGSWAFELAGHPAGAIQGNLSGVSCPSQRMCIAAGSFRGRAPKSRALIERSTGSRWRVQGPRGAAKQLPGGANAVSCPSARACLTVGSTQAGSGLMSQRLDGRRWTVRSALDPLGPLPSQLNGLSCPSATRCIAVGQFGSSTEGPTTPFAESWNGRRWTARMLALPAWAQSATLDAVSCSSLGQCTAVGTATVRRGDMERSLVEVLRAGSWKVQTDAGAANTTLLGVSCASTSACLAVGVQSDQLFSEAWNGSAWAVENVPGPASAGAGQLQSVWCGSPTVCEAVGYAQNAYGQESAGVAEAWNGTSWTAQVPALAAYGPAGATYVDDQFNGLWCDSATDCTAVGINAQNTLAEQWNGSIWTIQSTPNLPRANDNLLTGVACTSRVICLAVGYAQRGRDHALAATQTGSTWQAASTPRSEGRRLAAVACAAPTICIAVGMQTTNVGVVLPVAEGFR